MLLLKSHPDKKLEQHLLGVKEWGNHFLTLSPSNIIKQKSDVELLNCFLLLHDIGKATSYFQAYIQGEVVQEELKSHAHLSSLIFLKYTIVQGKLEKYEETLMAMYLCIFKHHDSLSSIKQCIETAMIEEELMKKQWDSIDKKELQQVLEKIDLDPFICELDFEQLYDNIHEILRKWRRKIRNEETQIHIYSEDKLKSFANFFLIQNLFSLLINADKSEVGIQQINLVEPASYLMNIEQYINSKEKKITKLNQMRQQAFEEVQNQVTSMKGKSIFTLTLPTGMGKTLNSLNFAFRLKKELEKANSVNYKIIYSLPFMSIIDQTVVEVEKILSSQNKTIDSRMLLKSHHLAEMDWNVGENTLQEKEVSKLLIDGWNSSIIITTFIQLFQTLIGYRNNSQRKFQQLNNAIIIVDEIQSLPVKYYQVIRNLLLEFTKYTNSKFILMTATQPKILEPEEYCSLCDARNYYLNLERTVILNEIEEKKTIQEFMQDFEYQKGKSYLIILNTIESSKTVYQELKEKYPKEHMVLLNTNFPPIVRKSIIQKIKNKEYDIVVSTQLVEAGVDIDLNMVYRDFAPLPQLLQSAGRSGREGINKGEVHIINLVRNNQTEYAKDIYNSVDLELTEQVLRSKRKIEEKEFIQLINQYYDLIKDPKRKSQDESIKLIKGLHLGKFSKRREEEEQLRYAEDFRLIEEKQPTVNIFIELDSQARCLWKQYEQLLEQPVENVWERKAKLENIRRKLAEYTITIRMNQKMLKQNLPPYIPNYYYVEENMLSYYYDFEYGFGKEEVIFI